MLAVLCRSMHQVCRAHLRVIVSLGSTAPFEEMLQQWRAVDNAVFDLTGARFEPKISHTRGKHTTP